MFINEAYSSYSMKRKVIEWGHNSYAMTIPIKWAREQGITKGSELTLTVQDEQFTVSTGAKQKKKKELTLELTDANATTLRLHVANAYRLGFDKIWVFTKANNKTLLAQITRDLLIGFELFEEKNSFLIESMTEPEYEHYEDLIIKLFFIIEQSFEMRSKQRSQEHAEKVQKYNNFIKRCISKKEFSPRANDYYWQFLSQLSKLARNFYYMDLYCEQENKQFAEKDNKLLAKSKELFMFSKQLYLKKDLSFVQRMHAYKEEIDKDFLTCNDDFDNSIFFFLMLIIYNAYHLSSPIAGIVQSESLP